MFKKRPTIDILLEARGYKYVHYMLNGIKYTRLVKVDKTQ